MQVTHIIFSNDCGIHTFNYFGIINRSRLILDKNTTNFQLNKEGLSPINNRTQSYINEMLFNKLYNELLIVNYGIYILKHFIVNKKIPTPMLRNWDFELY